MMWHIAGLVLLANAFLVYGNSCAGKADGNYEISCRSYIICHGGAGIIHNCPDPPNPNTVYNSVTKRCDNRQNVGPPCNHWEDCTGKKDARYPDIWNHCRSYYTCQNEIFYNHNICPAGLVFDSVLQNCNWPVNVAAPCGNSTK